MISKQSQLTSNQLLSIQILDTQEEFYINVKFTPQQLGVQFCQQFGLNLSNLKKVTQNLVQAIQAASELPQYNYLTKCYEKYFDQRQKIIQFKSQYLLSEFLVENNNYNKFEKSKSQCNLNSTQKENLQKVQNNRLINYQSKNQILKNCSTNRENNRFENLYMQGKLKQIERNKSRQTNLDKLDVLDENCTFRPNTRINQNGYEQSESIYQSEKSKQEKYYKKLFNYLDNDKDGFISKNCIDISKLNVNDVKYPFIMILAIFQRFC